MNEVCKILEIKRNLNKVYFTANYRFYCLNYNPEYIQIVHKFKRASVTY